MFKDFHVHSFFIPSFFLLSPASCPVLFESFLFSRERERERERERISTISRKNQDHAFNGDIDAYVFISFFFFHFATFYCLFKLLLRIYTNDSDRRILYCRHMNVLFNILYFLLCIFILLLWRGLFLFNVNNLLWKIYSKFYSHNGAASSKWVSQYKYFAIMKIN